MITYRDLGNKGRLGNCLFEAAATIALAVRNNDCYGFPLWEQGNYFNLSNCFHLDLSGNQKRYEEPHFHYSEVPYQTNLNLYGYFQSEKYFSDCKPLIRDLFTVKHFPISTMPDTVSLHVRRGDYLQLGRAFSILDVNYYHKALELVGAKKVMVFSEDVEWCKSNFVGPDFLIMPPTAPHLDMALMSCCEHNIIANSSFSWWGAWLNKNPNKKVVAPLNWFGPELAQTHNTKDLIPEGWSRI